LGVAIDRYSFFCGDLLPQTQVQKVFERFLIAISDRANSSASGKVIKILIEFIRYSVQKIMADLYT
jgi:hypothetical protein